jgi:hypothetical protein
LIVCEVSLASYKATNNRGLVIIMERKLKSEGLEADGIKKEIDFSKG